MATMFRKYYSTKLHKPCKSFLFRAYYKQKSDTKLLYNQSAYISTIRPKTCFQSKQLFSKSISPLVSTSSSSSSSPSSSSRSLFPYQSLTSIISHPQQLIPIMTLCCNMTAIAERLTQALNNGEFAGSFKRGHEQVIQFGDQFNETPSHIRMQLAADGYFGRELFDIHNDWDRYRNPHLMHLWIRYKQPRLISFLDPFLKEKVRKPTDPDYPMYARGDIEGRMMNYSWMDSPVLFEMILATRRKSLSSIEAEFYAELFKDAPFSLMAPVIGPDGQAEMFPEPPNGPAPPRRPRVLPTRPGMYPVDLTEIHFQC